MGRFQDPGCTIFVKNIESRVTEEHLWELFLQAGPLRNVHIPLDRESGRKRNFAFVTYRDECSVSYACELFDTIRLFKKPIFCQPSKDGKRSANQSNVSDASAPSPNRSSTDGFFGNQFPLASTPLHGKRKYGEDRVDSGRLIDLEGSRERSYNGGRGTNRGGDERDRSRYGSAGDRDRGRYDNSGNRERGRYNDSTGYRNDSRYDEQERERSPRRFNDRIAPLDRYDRSSSHNSSYSNTSHGNTSPMFMQAVNQSFNQSGRQSGSPRDDSSHRPSKRQRTF